MTSTPLLPAGSAIRARGAVRRRADGVDALVVALWLACGGLILLPIGALLVLAGRGDQLGVLLQGDVLQAGANSLFSATVSALAAVVIGTTFAVLLDRTDLPGRTVLRLLALSPLLMPPFVGAIAWLGIAGPTSPLNLWWRGAFGAPLWSIYGADGVILLLTIHSYPIAMLIVSAALRRIPTDLEQAARISGAGPARALTSVTVPLLRPALVSSFVLIAVGNLADFGIPSIIGLPERFVTLATLVYRYLQSGTVDDPLAVVATIGVVLLVLALLALVADALLARGGWELDSSNAVPERTPLGRARVGVGVMMWAVVLLITVLPLLALLTQTLLRAPGVPLTWENLTLDHLVRAVTTPSALAGAANSIMLASLAAVICGILGLAIGVVVARTGGRAPRALGAVAMVPQAIPGIVIAVAWLILAPSLGLFNTPWLILVAYVTSFTALVVQAVAAPLSATPTSAEEAARVAGAGRLRALVDISARMATPAAVAGAVIVAVTAVRELTLSVLLLSPGSQTLGVAIFNFQQAGAFSTASAWSLIVALVGLAVIGLATRRTS
ncbi:ABC transporter permease [Microbacterium arborescens]|uniref:ABC transporter permease n=1 Tax=Microbacterium arborescens TaxID=33883 RepID=UPI00277F5B4D|nr:iron ABC transporter permease [Microbacterium arborescens]MDQ1217489.1 iron(III) transport system permease protein [Microbacterium arborescens]